MAKQTKPVKQLKLNLTTEEMLSKIIAKAGVIEGMSAEEVLRKLHSYATETLGKTDAVQKLFDEIKMGEMVNCPDCGSHTLAEFGACHVCEKQFRADLEKPAKPVPANDVLTGSTSESEASGEASDLSDGPANSRPVTAPKKSKSKGKGAETDKATPKEEKEVSTKKETAKKESSKKETAKETKAEKTGKGKKAAAEEKTAVVENPVLAALRAAKAKIQERNDEGKMIVKTSDFAAMINALKLKVADADDFDTAKEYRAAMVEAIDKRLAEEEAKAKKAANSKASPQVSKKPVVLEADESELEDDEDSEDEEGSNSDNDDEDEDSDFEIDDDLDEGDIDADELDEAADDLDDEDFEIGDDED